MICSWGLWRAQSQISRRRLCWLVLETCQCHQTAQHNRRLHTAQHARHIIPGHSAGTTRQVSWPQPWHCQDQQTCYTMAHRLLPLHASGYTTEAALQHCTHTQQPLQSECASPAMACRQPLTASSLAKATRSMSVICVWQEGTGRQEQSARGQQGRPCRMDAWCAQPVLGSTAVALDDQLQKLGVTPRCISSPKPPAYAP